MRPKDQSRRRAELAAAARQVLLERGAVGLRVKDVAERSGLSPSSVLYYYPDLGDLLLDVARGAIERYAESRASAVRAVEGAGPQLRLAVHLGIPTGPEDEESRLLYELDALTGASRAFELLSQGYFDRQVHLYESLLEAGAARAEIEPAAPMRTIARGFVSMEDGLGFQVVIGHPGIGAEEAERILLHYGSAMTGLDLERVPLPDVDAESVAIRR